jgi:uncharacterized phage protein gp47/JayE
MSVFGITDQGFVKKTFSEILADKIERARKYFGDNIDVRPTSVMYKWLQLHAMDEAALWDLAEKYWYSMWLSTAEGVALEFILELLGLEKTDPVKAIGVVTFTGTNYSLIPIGTIVTTYELTQGIVRFKTTEARYIGQVDNEQITFADQGAGPTYTLDKIPVSPIISMLWWDQSANGGQGAFVTLTETTDPDPDPNEYVVNYTTGAVLVDLGSGAGMATGDFLRVTYIESGATTTDVNIECLEYGDKGNVPAASISSIETSVSGAETVTNTDATNGGRDIESDNSARKRGQEQPRVVFSPARIASEVENVDGVRSCLILEGVVREQFEGDSPGISSVTLRQLPQNPIREVQWFDSSLGVWHNLEEATAPLGPLQFECSYTTGVITLGSNLDTGDVLNVLYVDAQIGTGVFIVLVDPVASPLSVEVENAIAAVLDEVRPPGIAYQIQEIDKVGIKTDVNITIDTGYVIETVAAAVDKFIRIYIEGPSSQEESEESEYTGVGVGGLIVRNELIRIIMEQEGVNELADLVLHIEDEPMEIDLIAGNDVQISTVNDVYPYGSPGRIYSGKGKTGTQYVEGTDWSIAGQHITWISSPSGTVYINYKSTTGNAQIDTTQAPDYDGGSIT